MRIAAIGCGRHATNSLYPAFQAAGLELAATCARHLPNAELTAERFGAKAAFDDATKMLETSSVDAAVICVPADGYASLIRTCLEAGLAVFVEKPGAASAAEAEELAAISERAGLPVMVGYMKRFAPAYRRAKDIMATDEFGRPTLASFTFSVGSGYPSFESYVIDNTVHMLDLARFLLGEMTELQTRVTEAKDGTHAIAAVARSDSDAVVNFQLATTGSWNQLNETVQIFGEGQSLEVRNVDTLIHRPPEQPELMWRPNYTKPTPENTSGVVTGFVPELEHFKAVVIDGVQCESSIGSAAATLHLAEEIAR